MYSPILSGPTAPASCGSQVTTGSCIPQRLGSCRRLCGWRGWSSPYPVVRVQVGECAKEVWHSCFSNPSQVSWEFSLTIRASGGWASMVHCANCRESLPSAWRRRKPFLSHYLCNVMATTNLLFCGWVDSFESGLSPSPLKMWPYLSKSNFLVSSLELQPHCWSSR